MAEPLIENPSLELSNENTSEKQEIEQNKQIDIVSDYAENNQPQEQTQQEQSDNMVYENEKQNQPNEFKLDVSNEKTIDVISRVISKKIARHVSEICARDAVMGLKYAQLKKKYQKHAQKLQAVIEQNQKLRLLLVESNKNLNSYKPYGPKFLGLFKKGKSK